MEKPNLISRIALVLVLLLGFCLRFYKLGEIPAGLHVDEAALGYNAYSILKTGQDEFGKSFPVLFRSFSTYQSPVYTYLSVPIVAILGLSEFSTRLLSALLGFLSLPVLYILIKKYLSHSQASLVALVSTLFLAISPWHILYSRTAYETNIALFFLLSGVLLFYDALKRPPLLIISGISFVVSMYAYRAEILIAPILVFALTVKHRKQIFTHLISSSIAVLVSFILLIPLLSILKTPGFNARTDSLNIFGETTQVPWKSPAQEFSSLYSSYFSPRFMFSLGDSGPRKPYPDLATFYPWQFPLYLFGLYLLFKKKNRDDLMAVVLVLLFISPIPAALTRDPYSTLRSLPMVVPLVIIMAVGAIEIISKFKNKTYSYILFIVLVIVSTIRLYLSIFYQHDYFRLIYWDYGWREAINEIPNLDPNLPIVIDSTQRHPYILAIFFLKYDPALYQKQNQQVSVDSYYYNLAQYPDKNLGRISVRPFKWGKDTDETEQYIIATDVAISDPQIKLHPMSIIKEVSYPDGTIALRIIKVNPVKK